MDPLLTSTSLVTAFIAGIAALFAPCCITVLLPTYLASIFRQKRTVFLMTFVFFLGLLVVFMPLGLGAGGLGQLFSQYHNIIFEAGGLFLLLLGISILLGRHFSLPFSIPLNTKVNNAGSVFSLGIFSGFATLCCAPVLAGVLALSVLPGSILMGGIYSMTYVLGMVIPLFFIAYYLDKTNITEKFWILRKRVLYSIAGKRIEIAFADIVSGTTFLSMGVLILYLAMNNQIATHSSSQVTINIVLENLNEVITGFTVSIPEEIWAVLFMSILSLIIFAIFREWRKK